MGPRSRQSLEFGPYRLDRDQRLLFRGSEIIPLASKIYDTLLALVESGGRVVDKEDLLSRVWNGAFVEEGSLARNVSTLRKILGEGPRDTNTSSPSRNAVIVLPSHRQPPELWINRRAEPIRYGQALHRPKL